MGTSGQVGPGNYGRETQNLPLQRAMGQKPDPIGKLYGVDTQSDPGRLPLTGATAVSQVNGFVSTLDQAYENPQGL